MKRRSVKSSAEQERPKLHRFLVLTGNIQGVGPDGIVEVLITDAVAARWIASGRVKAAPRPASYTKNRPFPAVDEKE